MTNNITKQPLPDFEQQIKDRERDLCALFNDHLSQRKHLWETGTIFSQSLKQQDAINPTPLSSRKVVPLSATALIPPLLEPKPLQNSSCPATLSLEGKKPGSFLREEPASSPEIPLSPTFEEVNRFVQNHRERSFTESPSASNNPVVPVMLQAREEERTTPESPLRSEIAYPLQSTLKPTVSEEESIATTSSPSQMDDPQEPQTPPELAPATLTLQRANTTHRKAELTWGQYIYTVEQDLPATTTDDEWKQIVNAYATILNGTNRADCPAGIQRLEIALDENTGEMNIVLPPEIMSPSSPNPQKRTIHIEPQEAVEFLVSALTKTKTPVRSREIRQTAPLALKNETHTLCYLNSLIQMIMINPHLRDLFMKSPTLNRHLASYAMPDKIRSDISSLNPEELDQILFPGSPLQQRDLLEVLTKLTDLLQNEEQRKFRVELCTTRYFEMLAEDDPISFQKFVADHKLTPYEELGKTIYQKIDRSTSLPFFAVTPDPDTQISLRQAIIKQMYQFQTPKGDTQTIGSLEEGNMLRQEDEFTQFTSTPQTLFFHANRQYEHDTSVKNTGEIALEKSLALPGMLFSRENETVNYQLRSFAIHTSGVRKDGQHTANDGHYISYVQILGLDHKTHYYELDDAKRTEITEGHFLSAAKDFSLAVYDLIDAPISPTA